MPLVERDYMADREPTPTVVPEWWRQHQRNRRRRQLRAAFLILVALLALALTAYGIGIL
jgi:hypothetical protein